MLGIGSCRHGLYLPVLFARGVSKLINVRDAKSGALSSIRPTRTDGPVQTWSPSAGLGFVAVSPSKKKKKKDLQQPIDSSVEPGTRVRPSAR